MHEAVCAELIRDAPTGGGSPAVLCSLKLTSSLREVMTSRIEQSVDGRLTWGAIFPRAFESAWSMVVRLQGLNAIRLSELRALKLVTPRDGTTGSLFTSQAEWDIARLSLFLQVDAARLLSTFCDGLGLPPNPSDNYRVRHCPECRRLGYHSALFNVGMVSRCPWHDLPLNRGCTQCAKLPFSWTPQSEEGTPLWQCPKCSYSFDVNLGRAGNLISSDLEREIEAQSVRFVEWWKNSMTQAGSASSLLTPLARSDVQSDVSRKSWRLGWLTRLLPPPKGWGIEVPPIGASASLRVQIQETASDKPLQGRENQYLKVSGEIQRRFVSPHAECCSELLEMGPFERSALNSDTICTSCVAYLSWRAAHEGQLPGNLDVRYGQLKALPRVEGLEYSRLSSGNIETLLYASFLRIWADIEEVTRFSAMRVMRAGDSPEPLNAPYVATTACGIKEVIGILPLVSCLEEQARLRCEHRLELGVPMSHWAAAYANAGWNTVVDERMLFTARNHTPHFRNSYSYVYV